MSDVLIEFSHERPYQPTIREETKKNAKTRGKVLVPGKPFRKFFEVKEGADVVRTILARNRFIPGSKMAENVRKRSEKKRKTASTEPLYLSQNQVKEVMRYFGEKTQAVTIVERAEVEDSFDLEDSIEIERADDNDA